MMNNNDLHPVLVANEGPHPPLPARPASVVVSGDDDDSVADDNDIFPDESTRMAAGDEQYHDYDDDDDDDDNAYDPVGNSKKQAQAKNTDDFYDKNLDDEDEAYVYKYMRGGVQENLIVRKKIQEQPKTSSSLLAEGYQDDKNSNYNKSSTNEYHHEQIKVYKPRHSDAVLSCPCCFTIVCMDCQRHSRYLNQFRAMFVMGITVDWSSVFIYDKVQNNLIPKSVEQAQEVEEEASYHPNNNKNKVPHDHDHGHPNDFPQFQDGEYFAVLCFNCRTQVAVLDMKEEIYYFHGCLESS